MKTNTRSSVRSKFVHRSDVEQAEFLLKELPKKEKEHLSVAEALANMSSLIKDCLAKGYSYEDLATLLSDKFGAKLSVASLKRYAPPEPKRATRAKSAAAPSGEAPPRRGRKPKNAAANVVVLPTPAVDDPTIDAVVEELPEVALDQATTESAVTPAQPVDTELAPPEEAPVKRGRGRKPTSSTPKSTATKNTGKSTKGTTRTSRKPKTTSA